jgi:hypothetical protein
LPLTTDADQHYDDQYEIYFTHAQRTLNV